MYYLTILIGAFLGLMLFLFLFIIAKKTGLYYLPPLITFLIAIIIIGYSLVIGNIDMIDYGLLGIGFLIAAVVCAVTLPVIIQTSEKRAWTKGDVIGLIILPCILCTSIVLFAYVKEDSWVRENDSPVISEGSLQDYTNLSD